MPAPTAFPVLLSFFGGSGLGCDGVEVWVGACEATDDDAAAAGGWQIPMTDGCWYCVILSCGLP